MGLPRLGKFNPDLELIVNKGKFFGIKGLPCQVIKQKVSNHAR
jgi:hypothetical protein